jgi:L-2-hydroxyglutarate oxidase LhgO
MKIKKAIRLKQQYDELSETHKYYENLKPEDIDVTVGGTRVNILTPEVIGLYIKRKAKQALKRMRQIAEEFDGDDRGRETDSQVQATKHTKKPGRNTER